MKKILILSMYCNKELFIKEEQLIHETWANDIINGKYPNILFYGYTASTDGKYHINNKEHKMEIPCGDGLFDTAEKTLKCFRFIEYLGIEYDYIFRTNTSTYINVPLLNSFVLNLYDNDNIWSGVIYCPTDKGGPYPFCVFACGNSLLLSKYDVLVLSNPESMELAYSNDNANEFNSTIAPEIFKNVIYKVDDNCMSFIMNTHYIIKRQEDHLKHYKSFCVVNAGDGNYDYKDYIAIGFRMVIPGENEQTLRHKEIEVCKKVDSNITYNTDLSFVYEFMDMDLISMYGFGFIPRKECIQHIKEVTTIPYLNEN